MLIYISIFRKAIRVRDLTTVADQAKLSKLVDPKTRPVSLEDYCTLLKSCAKNRDLEEGRRIHAHISGNNAQVNVVLGRHLIDMYGKCGSVEDAQVVFTKIQGRDEFTWTAMVTAYAKCGHLLQAFHFFREMQCEGTKPSRVTFVNLLVSCPEDLEAGKSIHHMLLASGSNIDVVTGTCLINMYGNCGSLNDAQKVFEALPDRNVVSWTSMMKVYCQHGCYKDAMHLFWLLQLDGIKFSSITIVIMIDAWSRTRALEEGKLGHKMALECGFMSEPIVSNAIISMYGYLGSVQDARLVFQSLIQRTIVSWTAMIAACVQQGEGKEAIRVFREMQHEGQIGDKVTFFSVLNACASECALADGKMVHDCVRESGLESNALIGNALLNMYGKCSSLENAQEMLSKIENPDIVSWNTILAAYSQHGYFDEALSALRQMQHYGIKPNRVTFLTMIGACVSEGAMSEFDWIHASIVESGLESDPIVSTALIDFCAKCGSLFDAQRMFDKTRQQCLDKVSLNSMIAAYAKYGKYREAFKLFKQMQLEGIVMDKITVVTMLNVFANGLMVITNSPVAEAINIHDWIVESGLESDTVIASSLAVMYCKLGDLMKARQVFDGMQRQDTPSWNGIIGAYVQHEDHNEAIHLFHQMHFQGRKPDIITFITVLSAHDNSRKANMVIECIIEAGLELDISVANALLSMYSKCEHLKDLSSLLMKMKQKDVVTWTVAIGALGHDKEKALKLFQQMQLEGVQSNDINFVTLLDTFTNLNAAAEGRMVHQRILERGLESDAMIANALVTMYSKCGSLEEALGMFKKRTQWNVLGWSAIIAAYAHHGYGEDALRMFWRMQQTGVKPNQITFITVLSASSHAGDLEQGCRTFSSMMQDYNGFQSIIEHYSCIIDLLSRAGQLDEAEKFIKNMPFKPDSVVWMAVLSACRSQGDKERGRSAAECANKLLPKVPGPYIALANICSA